MYKEIIWASFRRKQKKSVDNRKKKNKAISLSVPQIFVVDTYKSIFLCTL